MTVSFVRLDDLTGRTFDPRVAGAPTPRDRGVR